MKVACDLSVTSAPHRPWGVSAAWDAPWVSPVSATAPGLVADFAAGIYGSGGTQSSLTGLVAFSRTSSATMIDETGTLVTVGPDTPRIAHDAQTSAPLGLQLEPAATNLVLNSDLPAGQDVTVAAVSHVLSFQGGGTVSLSGAHAASISGSGPAIRTELAFVPTAGTLTIAVSGEVERLQLETGSKASSYVSSGGTNGVRESDNAMVPVGNWFNGTSGTIVLSCSIESAAANDRLVEIDDGSTASRLSLLWNSVLAKPQFQVWNGGSLQAAIAPQGGSVVAGQPFRVALGFSVNDFAISMNGNAVATDGLGAMPGGLATLRLGRSIWGAQASVIVESVAYYPQRLNNAELVALSS